MILVDIDFDVAQSKHLDGLQQNITNNMIWVMNVNSSYRGYGAVLNH
jgi:hypothetical protein